MESGSGVIDCRLDSETDFGGAMALGLCGIPSNATSFAGRSADHGFGRFYSSRSILCMESVGRVLGQADSLLHAGESSGKRSVWDVAKDGIAESFAIQLPDPNSGRCIGSFVCKVEISSGGMHPRVLGLMGRDCVDLDGF